MIRVLVLCNHTSLPSKEEYTFDKTISINQNAPGVNLNLKITNITHRIIEDLDSISRDLLDIAAYVYYADSSVARWTKGDVFAEKWNRDFTFVIPVRNPDLWNTMDLHNQLTETLSYLTGDTFSFIFCKSKKYPEQLYLEFPDNPPPFPGADSICLFSGGLDSLAGSLHCNFTEKKRPILVSHRSMPIIDSRQKRLVNHLNDKMQNWEFPHLSLWVNRKSKPALENTQRSRSFLYLAIAATVAYQLNINKIYIYENGVVSFNIPKSGQNVGTMASRSTHPRFIAQFQNLIDSVFPKKLSITNPFIFRTKAEVAKALIDTGFEELIQASVSCASTRWSSKVYPHCGTCSQCLDRRFAIVASNLEQYDRDTYEKDIFTNVLKEGEETTLSENYVRTAIEIEEMTDVAFFSRYPELIDTIPYLEGTSDDEIGKKIYDLFQRHSTEVLSVIKQKYFEYHDDYVRGKLPSSCLISMVAQLHHLKEPIGVYAQKIGGIIKRHFEIAFQRVKPEEERDIQETAEAALATANERLNRESPMLSYSLVQTKPDFSDMSNKVFVELKFIKNRSRLNKIVTEITSRITIYRDQGAQVLFVVYDAARVIYDEEKFIKDLVKHEGVYTIIIKS